jgi:hypothetical protein
MTHPLADAAIVPNTHGNPAAAAEFAFGHTPSLKNNPDPGPDADFSPGERLY